MVSALLLLNLAGGEGLDDLDRLEADGGLGRLVRAAEAYGQSRGERRAEARRWRRQRSRTLPSPHAARAAAAVAHVALAACGGPVAGERRASAGGSGAAPGGAGDARHGRHADRDAQA